MQQKLYIMQIYYNFQLIIRLLQSFGEIRQIKRHTDKPYQALETRQ